MRLLIGARLEGHPQRGAEGTRPRAAGDVSASESLLKSWQALIEA